MAQIVAEARNFSYLVVEKAWTASFSVCGIAAALRRQLLK
jgi:hypothetical protein